MRTTSHLLILVIALALLASCGGTETVETKTPSPTELLPTSAPASAFPISMPDATGAEITIAQEPERIVSLAPSHTEILYALGLADRVVGVTEYCNYPPEASQKPLVGGFSNVDLEQVIGLDPDLVLATSLHVVEAAPALQERGIIVFVVDPQTIDEVLTTIKAIGFITGQEEAASTLLANLRGRIGAVRDAISDAPRPTVFWELGPELFTVGPGSFVNDLISQAGGENVASDADSPWPQLSVEAIVLKNPDVVVLADHNYGQTAEMVLERQGWSEIAAVAEGRIVEIQDDDIVSRPGPRIVDGLEFLARALHPDRFD